VQHGVYQAPLDLVLEGEQALTLVLVQRPTGKPGRAQPGGYALELGGKA
jgi:hypothetical protein